MQILLLKLFVSKLLNLIKTIKFARSDKPYIKESSVRIISNLF
jgi:hypothetical protein